MCEISCQKEFTAEYNTWEKEVDLKNIKEVVVKFEERMSIKIRSQEKLEAAEEKDFRRGV